MPYDLLPYCLMRSCGIDKSTAQAGADTLRGNLPFKCCWNVATRDRRRGYRTTYTMLLTSRQRLRLGNWTTNLHPFAPNRPRTPSR